MSRLNFNNILKKMRSKTVYLFVLILFGFVGFAQQSKKEIKQDNKRIQISYDGSDYSTVVFIATKLVYNKVDLDSKTFEYWLNSSYLLHDLDAALQCYVYFKHKNIPTKLEKKISSEALVKLNNLQLIYEHYPQVTEGIDHDKSRSEKINTLKNIIEIDPNYIQPYYYLGGFQLNNREYQSAITSMRKVLEVDPKVTYARLVIATAQFYLKQYEKSIAGFELLIKRGEKTEVVYSTKAYAHYNLNQYEKSIDLIEKALNLNQHNKEFCRLKVACERKLEKPMNELESLLKIVEFDIDDKIVNDRIVELANKIDAKNVVLVCLEKCIVKEPQNPGYYLFRIRLYSSQNQNEFENAMSDFDKLISMDSLDAHYYYLKGVFIYNSKIELRKEQAQEVFEKALSLDPYFFKTYDYICRLHMWGDSRITKKYKKLAIKNLNIKVANNPKDGQASFDLAEAYDLPQNGYGSGTKYRDSTLKYYDMALINDFDSMTVIGERKYLYSLLGKYENCIEDNLWMIERSNNPSYLINCYYSLANCYARLEQYEKEKEVLLKIKKDYPDSFLEKRLIEVDKNIKSTHHN
ncbi:MAG: tetratricopeptide repeat protein [Bacteroidetes bacterium]|nr:tetratricopeptide repeat protein [Bacteroidota bacterium]MBT7828292.1 tetratricopeptide repeat protein [Bacteroidota bacterium]